MRKIVGLLLLLILTAWRGVLAQESFAVGDKVIVQSQSLTLHTVPGAGSTLTDIPPGTVMSRLFLARKHLKQKMEGLL